MLWTTENSTHPIENNHRYPKVYKGEPHYAIVRVSMGQCEYWVQPKDRWIAERQCSRKEKFDTGLCTVHLRKMWEERLQEMSIVILAESNYDTRFNEAINNAAIEEYVTSQYPEVFWQDLIRPTKALAYHLSTLGTKAQANWDWIQEQPRYYQDLDDVVDALDKKALLHGKSSAEAALRHVWPYADYVKAMKDCGLDSWSESEYNDYLLEMAEYLSDMKQHGIETQEITTGYREEQQEFIVKLRERQRITLGGLVVPTHPLEGYWD